MENKGSKPAGQGHGRGELVSYLGELRDNWRPLLAATIGMASGMSLVGVITSTIVPSVVDDLRWSKAEFAAVGSLALFMSLVFPFIGRLNDKIGVRWTALIGQVTLPLVYLAYSRMGGDLSVYVAIFMVQSILCVTTTATVYTRLVVQYVRHARGMALAIVVSGPAVSGAIVAPFLNGYVESEGWRAAYTAVAIGTALAGLATFLLIPHDQRAKQQQATTPRKASQDYPVIFKTPSFWILAGAMLLCNLPQTLLLVQLKMLLLDNGITGQGAALMLSMSSIGMLAGRFVTGFALDRYQPYLVSFVTLALPSGGLFLIASSLDTPAVLTFAVFCLGFAFGSEGDIVGYLVARQFGVTIYSSVMGLLTAIMSFSTASGAALLSMTMASTGGFDLYLIICGLAVLAGAASLLLLGRYKDPVSSEPELAPAGPVPSTP
jgi:predicted MFS family arabinose efflux permease